MVKNNETKTERWWLIMAKNPRPINGPSTTGRPSDGGRGNNPPKNRTDCYRKRAVSS